MLGLHQQLEVGQAATAFFILINVSAQSQLRCAAARDNKTRPSSALLPGVLKLRPFVWLASCFDNVNVVFHFDLGINNAVIRYCDHRN